MFANLGEKKDEHILSHVCIVVICAPLFGTPWTSMGFPRQEYYSGLPFPPPGNLPDPGVESTSLVPPALACGFFTTVGRPLPHILGS